MRIDFTIVSKHKKHLLEIKNIMRSVMTDSGRYHEFDVFFDKLKISPWFYIEERFYANGEIDNEILPHKDSYIFNFCVDHCEDIDIIERKDDLLAIFANIEKYFNNEIRLHIKKCKRGRIYSKYR